MPTWDDGGTRNPLIRATCPYRPEGPRMSTTLINVRGLLTNDEMADVSATVLGNNPGMDQATAERIVIDALAYVTTAARNPGVYISPSRTVDEGWHALILHTALYARLCDRLGRFVHHYPERPDPTRHKDGVMDRTLDLMREAGHIPDMELWTRPLEMVIDVAANCSHTPKPGGCGPINPGRCASHCNSGGDSAA
ncbi:hypothetical protein SAMN05216259_12431 [Actinacidiphila guanduensis]|uniref:Uncharacterized protein n=2 Tax=Actinacidiphila guanduensis TaxID=310781 RepID=A0A1H0RVL8_9ACTN|nr:hypothetical protein SAMN05216259_12431 [Actinacidiphila guanduensis]